MFYQKGIHIGRGHEREMFDFLQSHFRYCTMNGWNRLESIANRVKIYSLKLPYHTCDVLAVLEILDWFPINDAIERWEADHRRYSVGFNGRSGGYLVLYNKDNNNNVIDAVSRYDTYEEFKEDYSTIDGNWLLRDSVKLVRDFDKLCDELRVITAYLTEMYVNGEITEEDRLAEVPVEYECIPKEFRKRIENS